jgi:hypothetical protein
VTEGHDYCYMPENNHLRLRWTRMFFYRKSLQHVETVTMTFSVVAVYRAFKLRVLWLLLFRVVSVLAVVRWFVYSSHMFCTGFCFAKDDDLTKHVFLLNTAYVFCYHSNGCLADGDCQPPWLSERSMYTFGHLWANVIMCCWQILL